MDIKNEIENAQERQRLFQHGYGNSGPPTQEDEELSRTEATTDYLDHLNERFETQDEARSMWEDSMYD